MSRVIDFRVRPPYGGYKAFFRYITRPFIERYGFEFGGSLETQSLDDLVAELRAAHVEKAVIQGRHATSLYVDNQDLFDVSAAYPDLFVPYPYIDVLDDDAVDQIERLIVSGPGQGASLEPGLVSPHAEAFDFDDPRAYPAYEALEAHHIPLLLTESGGFYKQLFNDRAPRQIDHVANDFPDLVIVVAHGAWPSVLDAISVASRRRNVYLAPDIYATTGAGAEDYQRAARTILRDKVIFESSYPILPIEQSIDFVRTEWRLDDETLDKVLYANAARVLGL